MLCKIIFGKKIDLFGIFIDMKKILRLTESELVRLVKRVINEQQEMTFQQYMDQLLDNPVEFLNKLNTDEQFKNAYIKSYGRKEHTSISYSPDFQVNPNSYVIDMTVEKYMVSNGVKISGMIKDRETNEVIHRYEISTLDELMKHYQFVKDLKAKGRSIMDVGHIGELSAVKNGKEVGQALNIAMGQNWYN